MVTPDGHDPDRKGPLGFCRSCMRGSASAQAPEEGAWGQPARRPHCRALAQILDFLETEP